jgi:hypothetical protein
MKASLWRVVLGLSVAALPLPAQQGGRDTGNVSPGCQEAAALVRVSTDAVQTRRAMERISPWCGEVGYSAVMFRIRQERTSRDTTLLVRLNRFLQYSPRGAFLETVLEMAQDSGASMEARGAALYVLTLVTHRDVMVDYHGVMSGVDRWGLPTESCFSHIADRTGPSGISPADLARVRQMAGVLYRDTTQPSSVRSAASCILS